MSRFHLYQGAADGEYLLDLQSDFLELYNSRVVAPVLSASAFPGAATGLNPVVELEGVPHVVLVHLLSAIPSHQLGAVVADLSAEADQFTRALDLLFQGY